MTSWHVSEAVDGPSPTAVGEYDLGALGYVAEERFISGTATSYRAGGDLTVDGRWSCEPDATASFTTRLVVLRPADVDHFNGTVVVEWLNVSAGTDTAPGWLYLHRELMRSGAAYVGVSAQRAGIDGGGLVPGPHLKLTHPERYGALVHPGDAFSFDIFSQAGMAVRSGGLLPRDPERIVACGASQSAVFLVTYVNAVDALARVFDGFIIQGRGGNGAPFDGELLSAEDRATLDLKSTARRMAAGHHVRRDTRVPVMIVQSETDQFVLSGLAARQPDSDRIRTWEIAGAAHADTYALVAAQLDDGSLSPAVLAKVMTAMSAPFGLPVARPINAGPQQHYVVQAAFAHLDRWIQGGPAPPTATPLETDESGRLVRDADGIAKGGVRTPWVDVPAAVLSGLGQEGDMFAILFGTTTPMPLFDVLTRYPGGSTEYRERFTTATQQSIAEGFLLRADEDEIIGVGAAQWPFWPLG